MRILRNAPEWGILNGDLATLLSIDTHHLILQLDTGNSLCLDPRKYPHIRLGYALTVHKAQGQTVANALLLPGRAPTRELTYVAATRARHQTHWYLSTPIQTLTHPMDKSRRKQFASELLTLVR